MVSLSVSPGSNKTVWVRDDLPVMRQASQRGQWAAANAFCQIMLLAGEERPRRLRLHILTETRHRYTLVLFYASL